MRGILPLVAEGFGHLSAAIYTCVFAGACVLLVAGFYG